MPYGDTVSMNREGSRTRTLNLLPNYFLSFDPPKGCAFNVKNDLVLGIPELKERNIKVVEKNDFDEIRLINAIISKQNTSDTHICIEYLTQNAHNSASFENRADSAVKLKHRNFFLCQEVVVIELDRELRLELLGNEECLVTHWPVVILNNVSQAIKSQDLLAQLYHSITDDLACLDNATDVMKGWQEVIEEENFLVISRERA